MALSKERKQQVIAQYEKWLTESEAVVLTEYIGLNMPQIDELRAKIREAVAFEDPPGVAKAIKDFGKDHEFVQIKGGFMDGVHMSADEIKALAELPPLPVVRGQLLGVISAPASKLVRTLAEPGRSLAQVVKSRADSAPAAA